MDKSLLAKLFGFPATLIHGDTLVLDRWIWIRKRLPETRNGETLLDVGCGTGAFSIGSALLGYRALGLSWDERNQRVAGDRAALCKASSAQFEVLDVRNLDSRNDLVAGFDVVLCCENIEHILDDSKLLRDIGRCMKQGGRLLLTTPYLLYRPISASDMGPFSKTEDGWHVRRGYTKVMLEELCVQAGLVPEQVSFCSGVLSQKITALQRLLARVHPLLGWGAILPLRILPPLFDGFLTALLRWPHFSICLEAYKPRHPECKSGQTGDA